MSLFAREPRHDDAIDATEAARPRMPLRRRIGWTLLAVAAAAVLALAVSPAPYVIEQPGPVFNTLGVDTAIGRPADPTAKPVLTVADGTRTYPTKGALDLLTVNVVGDPERRPSWIQVLTAWFHKSKSVVPLDVVFPPGQTANEADQQNAVDMSTSQQDATAAALTQLGYTIPREVVVAGLVKGGASGELLREGDIVTSAGGAPVTSADALRSAVSANGAGTPIAIGIQRDGKAETVTITPTLSDGKPALGVYVGEKYGAFPVKVDFQLADIGGPSAGQMFALGIIDKLTPGLLNGGQKVAGTGTIDAEGQVGAIGGIRQKMYGARDAGATVFLAPASNCDEVVGHIPDGLRVYAVSTLGDSLNVLKAVSEGASTAGLASCHK